MNLPETLETLRRRVPRTLLTVLISLLVLVAGALVLLPYGVQWYLGEWLRDRGVVNVRIGDVDINPFTGTFAIQSLEYEDDGKRRRAGHVLLNVSWIDLLNQRIRLSTVELRDASLEIRRTESSGWLLGTIVIGAQQAVEGAERTEAESGWGFGIDQLLVEDVAIAYRDPLIVREFVIDAASLNDLATWNPEHSATLAVALSSGDARLAASGNVRPFADTSDLDLRVKGENLDAAGLGALLQRVGIESVRGLLHADFRLKVIVPPADADTSLSITGGLKLDDWEVIRRTDRLALSGLDWDGRVDVSLGADGGQGIAVVLDGALDVDDLVFTDATSLIDATLGFVQWQGRAGAADRDRWRVHAGGEVVARQLSVGYAGQKRTLLNVSALHAALVDAKPGDMVSFDTVEVVDLGLFERVAVDANEPARVVSVARIGIDQMSIAADMLVLGPVLVSDAQLWLVRTPDGVLEIDVPSGGDTGSEAESAADNDQASKDPGVGFVLAGLKVAGKSRLVYVDRSVRPVARLELAALEIELGKVDAASPDNDTPISFTASQGRYGKLALTGQLRPLAQQSYFNAAGTITDLNLIGLDGFARRAIGYAIKSGTLSADIDVDLQDQRLDSMADLTIRKLEIDPLKPEDQDEFSTELGVPLGTALGLLEDDQKTIRLSVPLKGELSDLSVGVGDAVRLVMRKGMVAGMQAAATAYFAPLWPALAASKLFAAASKLSFTAVTFAAGDSALGTEQLAYLENMAVLLAKRPKVSLTICGRAVAADRTVLYPDVGGELDDAQLAALAELSQLRHQAAKDQLVEAGIDSARLVTCRPEASPQDELMPRVDFSA